MYTYKERKQRFFSEIANKEQIYSILKVKFNQKSLKIKFDLDAREIHFNEFNDSDHTIMVVTDENYIPNAEGIIVVSALLEKYFEADLKIVEKKSDGYFKCSINGGRIATTGRSDLRFKVNEDDVVATNFRFSKYSIDLNTYTLPTSIKVILDQFESSKRSSADFYEIGYFDTEDEILLAMKKTNSSLLISNLHDPSTFAPPFDGFLDFREILREKSDHYIAKLKEKGYVSVAMIPIVYISDSESVIPFAYIRMYSKTKNYDLDDVFSMKDDSFRLVERIREANTVLLSQKQRITDISRGGIKLLINNDELKRYLIKSRGFVFDIVFKLQAPITIYGEIRFTGTDDEKNLILGMCYVGNSSRKDQMRHLYDILEPMELEYKKKLILQMKQRQAEGR
ncbi:MAG: DUF1577 domain-containing protein [Spirochaetes bacterium]|nr:DUF1577 domain-containing protein [Spirochaetota bacterium]